MIFSGGLRNFRGGGGCEIFARVEKFSRGGGKNFFGGGLRNFQGEG